jgi:hypothetical protein
MRLIGNEKMPPSWSKRLEELIGCAVTGERRGVVEKLDALVKGYRPDYGFHGVAVSPAAAAANAATASFGEDSPDASSEMIPPPPKSVH